AVALCVVGAILNPLLFALIALSAPALVVTAKVLGGRTRRFAREWHDSLTVLGAETLTALRTLTLAKVAGAEAWELDRQDRRIDELRCAHAPQPYEGQRPIEFAGSFEFQRVSFAYQDEPTLRGVDLAAGAGEHVALLGPNGAGKSTLVSLLLGLYRPDDGRVLADGIPLDELDLP